MHGHGAAVTMSIYGCDIWPSQIITDYRLLETRSISADEMYLTICVESAGDHFGLRLT